MFTTTAFLFASIVACIDEGPPLVHDAYVWQRVFTPAVDEALEHVPSPIAGLRVLALEIDRQGIPVTPAVDARGLAAAKRSVTAVVRIDGSRPSRDRTLAPILAVIERWRAAGVEVVGVEVDHDCATAALGEYADWLARERPAGLRFSITALPTWASSDALGELALSVDEIVLQVHAVRAPTLFDAREARRDLETFADRVDRPIRVALPTYRVAAFGTELVADPSTVAAFVRELEEEPVEHVAGVVWFRLPVPGDDRAWGAPTLTAVMIGAPLVSEVTARVVDNEVAGHDVIVENTGTLAGLAPSLIEIDGATDFDGVQGYARTGNALVATRAPAIPAGGSIVVGWVRGAEVAVHAK